MTTERVDVELEFWDGKARTMELPELRRQCISDPAFTPEICVEWITVPFRVMRPPPRRILEVGCGIGRVTIPMARAFPDVEELVGIDISPTMVALAQQELAKQDPRPPVRFEVTDGRTVPGGVFEAAYSLQVFQHIDAAGVRAYIEGVSGVLRTGGLFHFQISNQAGQGPMDFRHQEMDLASYCWGAGMKVQGMRVGGVSKAWSWVVAEKRT